MNNPDDRFFDTPTGGGFDGINPYAAPEAITLAPTQSNDAGLVRHVLPVSILMIVQGSLELLIALMVLAMAGIVPWMMAQDPQAEGAPIVILITVYAVMGGVSLIIGLLHVFAGIFGLRFQRRVLGIVALIGGIGSIFTCYCAPTGIALAIYGLITYTNPRVREAFDMVERGMSAADVRAHFRC